MHGLPSREKRVDARQISVEKAGSPRRPRRRTAVAVLVGRGAKKIPSLRGAPVVLRQDEDGLENAVPAVGERKSVADHDPERGRELAIVPRVEGAKRVVRIGRKAGGVHER